jgi:hypothetical protein
VKGTRVRVGDAPAAFEQRVRVGVIQHEARERDALNGGPLPLGREPVGLTKGAADARVRDEEHPPDAVRREAALLPGHMPAERSEAAARIGRRGVAADHADCASADPNRRTRVNQQVGADAVPAETAVRFARGALECATQHVRVEAEPLPQAGRPSDVRDRLRTLGQ